MAVARVPVPVPEAVEAAPPGALSRWLRAAREFCAARPLGAVGGAVIIVMFAVALLAPVLAPYDPEAVGFGASVLGATLGAILGVASAYFGGRIDLYLQRVMDVFLSFPLIILALAL